MHRLLWTGLGVLTAWVLWTARVPAAEEAQIPDKAAQEQVLKQVKETEITTLQGMLKKAAGMDYNGLTALRKRAALKNVLRKAQQVTAKHDNDRDYRERVEQVEAFMKTSRAELEGLFKLEDEKQLISELDRLLRANNISDQAVKDFYEWRDALKAMDRSTKGIEVWTKKLEEGDVLFSSPIPPEDEKGSLDDKAKANSPEGDVGPALPPGEKTAESPGSGRGAWLKQFLEAVKTDTVKPSDKPKPAADSKPVERSEKTAEPADAPR